MDKDAFELANSIRYKDDRKTQIRPLDSSNLQSVELGFSLQSLKVTKEITPSIYDALQTVCERLYLKKNIVVAYITSSSDIQAQCISFNTESCLITLSSELTNLLNQKELEFVIGHELGHFLFQHNIETRLDNSKESFIALRAKEISVDRIGLCACRDLDVAMKSIIKILSGLDDRLLRFDLNAFLQQIEHKATIPNESQQIFSTHPSLLLRAKALVRFSLCQEYQQLNNKFGGSNLNEIDNLIRNDLDFYIDSHTREQIENSREFVEFWTLVYSIVKSGSLTKSNQDLIENRFGKDKKNKLINMLDDLTKEQVEEIVRGKIIDSIANFKKLAPTQAKEQLNMMIIKIEKETNDSELLKQIQRMI